MTRRRLDPTLTEAYAYEAGKRSSWAGIGQAALAGDPECLRRLAEAGAVLMRKAWQSDSGLADAAFWLHAALTAIQMGQSPNEAFGLEQPGKPGRRSSFRALRKQVEIGHAMRGMVARLHRCRPADGHQAVLTIYPNAKDHSDKARLGRPVSKADATAWAAAVVAAHYACSPETAVDYMRKLGNE